MKSLTQFLFRFISIFACFFFLFNYPGIASGDTNINGPVIGTVTVSIAGQQETEGFADIFYLDADNVLHTLGGLLCSSALPSIEYYMVSTNKYCIGNPISCSESGISITFNTVCITFAENNNSFTLTGSGMAESLPFTFSGTGSSVNSTPISINDSIGGLSGGMDSVKAFSFDVPSNSLEINVNTVGGSGDVDLYVSNSQPPFDTFSSEGDFANENIVVPNPSSGTWYILLVGYTAYNGVTLTVNVIPIICDYAILPTSKSVSPGGGAGSVSVSTSSGCSWAASSNASWITITSGSSGNGNGMVDYSVSSNSSTSQRTGTMTIAGKSFTITQNSCNYSLSSTSNTFTAYGGNGSVSVSTSSGCPWTATSNASWITITTGSSKNGNGTVNYSVLLNSSTSQRTGTMTIAGKSFTVTQEGLNVITSGDIDDNAMDDVITDFGPGTGTYVLLNNSTLPQLHALSPETMVTGDIDGGGMDDIILDFGSLGIWVYMNNTSWVQLHTLSPEIMISGDIDGSGKDDIIVDFGRFGTWVRMNNSSWIQLHSLSPETMTIGDIDGGGSADVILDFGSLGTWIRMNNSTWAQLHTLSPETMVTGDIDGSGKDDIIVDFGSLGTWVRMNDSSWAQLHTLSPETMVTGDYDGIGSAEVILDFGSLGIWAYMNNATWSQLHTLSAVTMTTGDVDGNGQDEIIIDFGPPYGIWILFYDRIWSALPTP